MRRLPLAGAQKGTDAQVAEDGCQHGGDEELLVVGALGVVSAGAPEAGGEEGGEKAEEEAGDF